eukprot:1219711-Pyramimonas_sp.AAC.1
MIDGATRYCALRTIKTETAEELIKAVERGWIKQFGTMGDLRADDGSAGEAHSSQGVVERRHQVIREAMELHCADVIDRGARSAIAEDLLTEACIYVPHQ